MQSGQDLHHPDHILQLVLKWPSHHVSVLASVNRLSNCVEVAAVKIIHHPHPPPDSSPQPSPRVHLDMQEATSYLNACAITLPLTPRLLPLTAILQVRRDFFRGPQVMNENVAPAPAPVVFHPTGQSCEVDCQLVGASFNWGSRDTNVAQESEDA